MCGTDAGVTWQPNRQPWPVRNAVSPNTGYRRQTDSRLVRTSVGTFQIGDTSER